MYSWCSKKNSFIRPIFNLPHQLKEEGCNVYLDQSAEIGCWFSQIIKNIQFVEAHEKKENYSAGLGLYNNKEATSDESSAILSKTSIKNIRSIYYQDMIPSNFSSEKTLIQLFEFILEINKSKASN